MKTLLILFLVAFSVFGYTPACLISDEEFTNQNFNEKDAISFIRTYFPNCPLTDNEIKWGVSCCYANKINILVLFTKYQQEQSLIGYSPPMYKSAEEIRENIISRKSQALGCRLYSFYTDKPRLKYWGFGNQTKWGTHLLREYFEDFEYGNEVELEDGDYKRKTKKVWPVNAATWALYVYCPSYGVVSGHPWTKGRQFTGNSIFGATFEDYKKKWIKLFGVF